MIAGCEILSEMNTGSCIDLMPCKDIRGSQGRSGIDAVQQGGYAGKTSVEQDTGEDICQRYLVVANDSNISPLPSAKSCQALVHDDQLCMDYTTAMVECMTPSDKDLHIVSPATLDGVVPNPLRSDVDVNFDAITASPTEEFSDSGQSMEKSAVPRLSSVGMGNCSATGPGNSLAIIKYEVTPISKYVASRTHDSSSPLSPESAGVHESVIDSNGLPHAPFVKTSPMWAQLESLEIFSKVPQRPHFQLLQHLCPELCEGMALGLMFSFAKLAESINRLNVPDENGLLEEKMVVLCLLEANGFDVRDLKSRLEALLGTKISRVELQNAMNKLEEKIVKKETEDRELSTQIRMLAKALHRLDVHAYLMRDMMMSAISQKMNQAKEISKLKTEANELE